MKEEVLVLCNHQILLLQVLHYVDMHNIESLRHKGSLKTSIWLKMSLKI